MLYVAKIALAVVSTLLWATWELDLDSSPPPLTFVLTATNQLGGAVPPPYRVRYGACTQVPQAQHCAPLGCPPRGAYTFTVQAEYADGPSDPSNVAVCTLVDETCTCKNTPPPLPPPPTPVDTRPLLPDDQIPPLPQQGPDGLGLTDEAPPLPQQGPEGLDLRDPSEGLPPIAQPDPIPPSYYEPLARRKGR
jgi:hypothetical protein